MRCAGIRVRCQRDAGGGKVHPHGWTYSHAARCRLRGWRSILLVPVRCVLFVFVRPFTSAVCMIRSSIYFTLSGPNLVSSNASGERGLSPWRMPPGDSLACTLTQGRTSTSQPMTTTSATSSNTVRTREWGWRGMEPCTWSRSMATTRACSTLGAESTRFRWLTSSRITSVLRPLSEWTRCVRMCGVFAHMCELLLFLRACTCVCVRVYACGVCVCLCVWVCVRVCV